MRSLQSPESSLECISGKHSASLKLETLDRLMDCLAVPSRGEGLDPKPPHDVEAPTFCTGVHASNHNNYAVVEAAIHLL